MDYVFIAAYWLLFALLACVLARRGGGWPLYVAAAATLAGTAAAVLDHVENVRMTRVLDAMALGGVDVASAGLMKWLFSFVAVALLSSAFLGRGGWVWIVGVVCIAIAALGLAGVAAIRSGARATWPIEYAFMGMMLLLLPLVAIAFIRFTHLFQAGPG